jgi:hypothetical protein
MRCVAGAMRERDATPVYRYGCSRRLDDDAFCTGYIVVRPQQAALCGHIH